MALENRLIPGPMNCDDDRGASVCALALRRAQTKTMASAPTIKATGLSTQRQLDALYSAPSIFTPETIHKAKLSTGITVEYALHGAKSLPTAQEHRVVMVNGYRQHQEEWAPIIRMMIDKHKSGDEKKTLKILTLNNRGMGDSSAPWGPYSTSGMARDVMALMDHVGWESAHVVGVSMGGMISLELAAQAPDRVRSLSLVVTTRGKFKENKQAQAPLFWSIVSRNPNRIVANLIKLLYPEDCLTNTVEAKGKSLGGLLKAYHRHEVDHLPRPSMAGILGQSAAIKTHFVSDKRLEMIKNAGFPVLVVGGMKDILVPVVESFKLLERMKADHVKSLLFQDGGHGLYTQFVEEVTDGLIATFARSSA